ncbi:MAG: IS200/IS605 family transposase [Anaerolineae bacterium]
MPYWQLHYHLIWATKDHEPVITPEFEPKLWDYLRGKGLDLGGKVHAVGGVADHVHIAVSIPPRIAVASYIGQLKGASSHWMTHLAGHPAPFEWQDGYGAFSFSRRSLPQVVQYVLHQHEHHQKGNLIEEMERIEVENYGP